MEGERGSIETERRRDKKSRQERSKDHSGGKSTQMSLKASVMFSLPVSWVSGRQTGRQSGSGGCRDRQWKCQLSQKEQNSGFKGAARVSRSTKTLSAWMILPFPSTLVCFGATGFDENEKKKSHLHCLRYELACNNRHTENYPLILDVCKPAVCESVVEVLIQQ